MEEWLATIHTISISVGPGLRANGDGLLMANEERRSPLAPKESQLASALNHIQRRTLLCLETKQTMEPTLIIVEFLKEKFRGAEGRVVVWQKETNRTKSFDAATELDAAAAYAAKAARDGDIYVPISTQEASLPPDKRGGSDTVRCLTGFFADIDLADAKGGGVNYPKDESEALSILSEFALKPTSIINSGNGLHVNFDFDRPWLLASNADRDDAKALSAAFQTRLAEHFRNHGRKIDSVGDLVRGVRIPGTFNHKSIPPKPVALIRFEPENRVTLAEVRAFVSANKAGSQEKPVRPTATASHDLIVKRCAWYGIVVVEGAATCGEPDWFAGASITALCKNGQSIFLEYSRKHPKFKEREAREKFARAAESNAPRTCKSVAETLGHRMLCEACAHQGKIASPIQLGRDTDPVERVELGGSHSDDDRNDVVAGAVGKHAGAGEGYDMTNHGLFFTKGKGDKSERIFVSGPFEIIGMVRDAKSHGWARFIRWRDHDGQVQECIASDKLLLNDHEAICGELADRGLLIGKLQQVKLAGYILAHRSEARITLVNKTGWHEIGKREIFALPGQIIGETNEPVVYEGAEHRQNEFNVAGTLEAWRQTVSIPAGEHQLAALVISASLAGPLLHLAGQESGGIHLFGPSSSGKTTLLQLAASVWGGRGLVNAWRATANGLEGLANKTNDVTLILDELGQIDSKDAASALYMLSAGIGKIRMNRNATLQDVKTWRAFIISSGEMTVEAKIQQLRGATANTGATLRLLNVTADRGQGFGAFDDAGPTGNAGDLVRALAEATLEAHGVAGPEFVRALIARESCGEEIRATVKKFCLENVEAGSDGQIERAAKRFGLIAAAGELASELGATGWDAGTAWSAAVAAFERWKLTRGGDSKEPAEDRRIIMQVTRFLVTHGDSGFEELDRHGFPVSYTQKADDDEAPPPPSRPVLKRYGWRKYGGEKRIWMIDDSVWETEVCLGFDPQRVSRVLARHGFLKTSKGRFTYAERYQDKRNKRFHVIKAKILTSDYDRTEADAPDDDDGVEELLF
jgi:uncharacterized protein (DUF927 family)